MRQIKIWSQKGSSASWKKNSSLFQRNVHHSKILKRLKSASYLRMLEMAVKERSCSSSLSGAS